MGNYHPTLMKIATQTRKNMLTLKFTKAEVQAHFQDGRCRQLEIEGRAKKWAVTTRF
jgi:hypothetical protein